MASRIFRMVYLGGAAATASIIGSGNLINSVGIAGTADSFPEGVGIFLALGAWSIGKGATYGVLWPAFIPYAVGKGVDKHPDSSKWIFNKDALSSHFVPMASLVD